ncbi:hypothetical protein PACTADRAFT_185126 [Pachysolen tannophilus NRRL Y-2460]|uniref:Uncharacterized protein n=1 Tax=Pachysolen tannophilus NRRL Y-2460 TaxID=669874 RepID=A0A1E4U2Y9_PACTA|nr:hypothetical protein PACTADRAFT_185126 [Pachysolen tannophilus NRRL Y-2460]
MSPPIPVYSKKEIDNTYKKFLKDDDANCTLYSLIQNQCTFNGSEIICLPFKRLFTRCLRPKDKTTTEPRYQLIEITDETCNDYFKFNQFYQKQTGSGDDLLEKFLKADEIMRKVYQDEMNHSD